MELTTIMLIILGALLFFAIVIWIALFSRKNARQNGNIESRTLFRE